MAKNDFKAFATDRNANVISQEEWEALPALLSGFTAGKASSAQVNKVIRQASFIAAALAQFVSDKTQRDVLDNGDLPGFVELLGSGFAVEYLSRKNPFGDIKSDSTVKTALENLGLGEGSALPVGVPIPWPSATPPGGWLKCNGATFDKAKYPQLAKVYPTGKLPDLRGVFIRGWDDGRGIDTSRALLSEQQPKVGQFWARGTTYTVSPGSIYITDAISIGQSPSSVAVNNDSGASENYVEVTPVDTRPINNAFNYIVRAA
ncbi:tail fiber protein [Escherichia coli]|nr:tail fiber protein [Escherichia coli]